MTDHAGVIITQRLGLDWIPDETEMQILWYLYSQKSASIAGIANVLGSDAGEISKETAREAVQRLLQARVITRGLSRSQLILPWKTLEILREIQLGRARYPDIPVDVLTKPFSELVFLFVPVGKENRARAPEIRRRITSAGFALRGNVAQALEELWKSGRVQRWRLLPDRGQYCYWRDPA
ncbi:MAG: hypothetical protein QHG98_03810 [Methanothrix sp.]|nr:hypothetical protein [Methanothrix sp.]